MSLLKTNEIQVFNGTTVTITATTAEVSADLNVGADLDVTGALTLGTALAIAEGGTGATDAATARTNLDVDQAGTDNSTDCTLVTTSHDYLSISGQAITLGPIDLAADVTGNLPYASISGTPTLGTAAAEDVGYFATAAQGALADSAVQPGDDANTLGSGAATDGYVLTADGAGGAAWEAASGVSLPIDLLSSGASLRKSDGTTAVLSESGGVVTLENASLGDTVLMPDNSNNVSTAPGIRFEADTDTGIGLASAGNLAIVTGGSERLRIDDNGNLLVGTTSNNIGGTNYNGQTIESTTRLLGLNSNTATGGVTMIAFHRAGTQVGSITCGATATAFNTSSDYRLKEDLQPIVGAIDRLQALKPVNFAWKIDGSRVDGFIAHEAQKVVPEAVTGSKDAVDENGNPEYQGIDQSKLVPLLTAALQETLMLVETQAAKIDALETRIQALEA